jgi:hypothetical protein
VRGMGVSQVYDFNEPPGRRFPAREENRRVKEGLTSIVAGGIERLFLTPRRAFGLVGGDQQTGADLRTRARPSITARGKEPFRGNRVYFYKTHHHTYDRLREAHL